MGHIIGFLFFLIAIALLFGVFGLFFIEIPRSILGNIFMNSPRDTGIVRMRGFIFLCFMFSFLLSIIGLFGAHNSADFWGYLSLVFLFVFSVSMLIRFQYHRNKNLE